MKLFIIVIIFLAIAIIGAFLISRLLDSLKIIKQLRKDRNELIEERAKQSNQLRQKGVDIGELKIELDRYSDIEPKVALTSREKRMILNALEMPHYQSLVQNPKTKFLIREIYRNLKEKIKASIKE